MINPSALKQLSDNSLLEKLKVLKAKADAQLAEMLLYLAELDSRRLYVRLGSSSLFAYCTEQLGFSAPAAQRRIVAARVIDSFPELLEQLHSGRTSLCKLAQLRKVLTPQNKERVLADIEGMSFRELEQYILGYQPQQPVAERIRPLAVLPTGETKAVKHDLVNLPLFSQATDTCELDSKSEPEPKPEQRFELRFSITAELMKEFERVKSALSNKHPTGVSLESAFGEMVHEYNRRCSPTRELKRASKSVDPTGRHIPRAVVKAVYERDNNCCTFVASDGRRCSSSYQLQIDHVLPHAMGGHSELDNLRLLCATHHRFETERLFGKDYIQRKINAPATPAASNHSQR